jgi:hypothetical protein
VLAPPMSGRFIHLFREERIVRTNKLLLSGAICAALLAVIAPEARATLNLSSSTKAQCVGGLYGAANCEVLRFTLNIPDPQVPLSVVAPSAPGTYENFGVSEFSLQSFNGWQFFALESASPGYLDAGYSRCPGTQHLHRVREPGELDRYGELPTGADLVRRPDGHVRI